VAYEELIPPLAPAWTADYSAGAGRGSPVVTDSTVFVGTLRGELFAFRMRDGYRLGKAGLGNAIDGSPAIVQGSAIVALSASARSLVRFDLVDGTVIWETQCGDVETTPLVTGDRVFVGNTAGTFTCVSVHTGEIQWQFPLPGNDRVKGIRSAPSAFGNLIVFGADDGVVYALDSGSGKVVWTHRAGDVVLAPPVVVDTTIVIGTLGGTVTALAGRTGVPFWSRTLPGGIAGPVTVDPRRVVAATLRGVITALDRTTGLPLWTVTPGTPMNSGGVIVGSYYYTGTLTKELLAVRVADGEIVWRTTLEGRVKSGPAVARGRLLLATDAQTLIAFGPQMKRP
jgi:outer membrane protein assembly factor BamB